MKENDSLSEIFKMQEKLQALHGHNFDKMTTKEKESHTKDTILYLLEEAHELLRETNFKTHKKKRKPIDIDKIHGEIVDIGCFLFNLALLWKMSPEEFLKKFIKKNNINVSRIADKDY